MEAFTARNFAKYAVRLVIQQKTTDLTRDAITDYTSYEEDQLVVTLGANAVGWYVSDKIKPYTDRMVDKTADFIAEKRATRATQKETPTEE